MMRWGATDVELQMTMPGDDLIANPAYRSTRAVTTDAPADEVWQWLALTGWILSALELLFVLLQNRQGRWWLPLTLAYMAVILWNTGDWRAALAGFLVFAVPIAGFALDGGRFGPWFAVIAAAVLLILLLTPVPYVAFGLIFLIASLALLTWLFSTSSSRTTFPHSKAAGAATP